MAIDTENKRRSCISHKIPGLGIRPSPDGAISTCRKCEPVTKPLKNKGFKYKCIQYCECSNSGRFVDLKNALLEAKEQYDSDLINWGV